MARTLRLLGGVAAVALVGSLAALKLLPAPFVWIFLLWAVMGLVVVARADVMALRLALLAGSAVLLVLAAAEGWLAIAGVPRIAITRDYTPHPYVSDSVLGWRLVPGQVTRAVARLGDHVIYDVQYRADSLGRRVAYPDSGPAQGCVLFFVCSFSFGEGVQDSETLPYRVGARTGGRFRVVNFGVPGYGPEQMLAALESGDVAARSRCEPTNVVYQALAHHVLRSAGKVEFSLNGPRYVLGPGGLSRPQSATGFTQPTTSRWTLEVTWQLQKSHLYRVLTERRPPNGTPDDVNLYLAILRRTTQLLAERYPRSRFDILAWDLNDRYAGDYAAFRDSLAAVTPRVHDVSTILPEYRTHPERYEIHPQDHHPNPLAYDLLAGYVADSILGGTASGASAPKSGSARHAAR